MTSHCEDAMVVRPGQLYGILGTLCIASPTIRTVMVLGTSHYLVHFYSFFSLGVGGSYFFFRGTSKGSLKKEAYLHKYILNIWCIILYILIF